MEPILILLAGLAYRIRGGLGNEYVRKLLKKPEGWEIPNNYIRSVWALYVAMIFPISLLSPLIFMLALIGVIPGYFGGKFDLTLKQNRTWKNYAWLSARGAWICLPLAVCFYTIYPWLFLGVIAGAFMPVWYLIGTVIPEKKGVISHSQIGEWLIGLSIGGALCLRSLS